MAIGRSDLVDSLVSKTGLTKIKSNEVINTLIGEIQKAVASGDTVNIVGFGVFEARARPARKGRNPATGAAIEIEAKRVPAFKPGAAFKKQVAGK